MHAVAKGMKVTVAVGPDEALVKAVSDRINKMYHDGLLVYMIDLGFRTGLFEALAPGEATSVELAGRAGLNERYVRQWLGAMVTGDLVDYDPSRSTYNLPPVHAAALTGEQNDASFARVNALLGRNIGLIEDAFRNGGGVPYSEFTEMLEVLDDQNNLASESHWLKEELVPLVEGLDEQLSAGCRVADIGCAGGVNVVNIAQTYPASTVVGYDLSETSIARATALVAKTGVVNARFEVVDAVRLQVDEPYDVITTFGTMHDQVDLLGVLTAMRRALTPQGILIMGEPHPPTLEEFVGNPWGPFMYSFDVLHCMTVSLASGGDGNGCATFTEDLVLAALDQAGFGRVEVHPSAPGEFPSATYIARPKS